jgi:hypothetical protein
LEDSAFIIDDLLDAAMDTPRRRRIYMNGAKYGLAFLVLAGILSAASAAYSYGPTRRAQVCLIRAGYTGWVKISYSVAGAPELPVVDGAYTIGPSGDGHATTSTKMGSGLAEDKYFYVDGDGTRDELSLESPPGIVGIRGARYFTIPKLENQRPQEFRVFFVGTLGAYQNAPKADKFLISY